jgi:hypothetical protein
VVRRQFYLKKVGKREKKIYLGEAKSRVFSLKTKILSTVNDLLSCPGIITFIYSLDSVVLHAWNHQTLPTFQDPFMSALTHLSNTLNITNPIHFWCNPRRKA